MKYLVIILIRGYQIILSPLLPNACRFIPTCSDYTLEAVKKYGFFKGLWLGLKRIIRCRPGGGCDYDPVP